ncbi:hypothetical protein PspLS_11713 [Pyricularia sp. CBS 133598]|nr:hypothetical protein PspLS_11713 [Pyricularia sp. CBS 133598]
MPPLLLLLCFVPFLRMLIRECSLCCSLETESLTPTGPSRDSAAHIALAATATMVERGPKDKLWVEKGADVRVKGSAGNPLKRSALGSLDTFPSRWEDYCAFFPSSRRRAAPHTRRNCRFFKVEDVDGRVVNLLGQFGPRCNHFLHTTQIRLAPGKSMVFFQVESVLKFDRRPLSEQQQVAALRQQHASGSGDQVTEGPGTVPPHVRYPELKHVTLFSLALGRLGSSVVCVVSDSVVVLAVVYLRSPQVLVSIAYMSYDELLTRISVATEWNSFAAKTKGLRVSASCETEQRGTYLLGLAWRYGIVLQLGVDWLVS